MTDDQPTLEEVAQGAELSNRVLLDPNDDPTLKQIIEQIGGFIPNLKLPKFVLEEVDGNGRLTCECGEVLSNDITDAESVFTGMSTHVPTHLGIV